MEVAISGMAVNFPGCPDLRTFQELLRNGLAISDCEQARNDCQQQNLWQVCQQAVADAALPSNQNFVTLFSDTNQKEADLSDHLATSAIYLPAGPGWLFLAWQQARYILSENSHDAVVAAVAHPSAFGAAAVVFQRLDDARQAQSRVYAVASEWPAASTAGSLELGGQLDRTLAEINPARFMTFINAEKGSNLCALSTITETLGFGGELADLIGLIRASLSLHQRTHFAVPHWQGPLNAEAWDSAPFYVPADSRPWFTEPGNDNRQAVLICADSAGKSKGLALAEEPQLRFPAQAAFSSSVQLLPIQADSQAALQNKLDHIASQLDRKASLPELAGQCLAEYDCTASQTYTLGLVGASTEELQREIEHAQRGIERAFETGKDWQSPAGSAFSAQPLGPQAKVAFVYPGGFNSHVGMAQNLFSLFPRLQDRLFDLTENIDLSLQTSTLYPRSIAPLSEDQIAALDAQLSKDPIAMITTGTAVAFLYTTILQEVFGLRPESALGYSLGENSMMFALGVWEAADEARSNFSESPLFHSRLAGPTMAARQHWGWPPQDANQSQEPLWGNFILMATPVQIQAALAAEEHAYLTHINAPRQVVIGGELQACKRVIASLKCMSLQAPYDYALHCEAMASEFLRLEELHTLPVESIPQTVLYTAADYHPTTLDSAIIAENIATALTNRLDFPRLVEKVYEDGARMFIEVGAGSNCAKWIGSILKNKPHAAVWVDQAKVDEQTMLVRLLAKLISQGVSLDLSALQNPRSAVPIFNENAVLEMTG